MVMQERKQKETIRTLREQNKEKDRLIESSTSQRVVTVKEESQNDLEVLPPEPVMMEVRIHIRNLSCSLFLTA